MELTEAANGPRLGHVQALTPLEVEQQTSIVPSTSQIYKNSLPILNIPAKFVQDTDIISHSTNIMDQYFGSMQLSSDFGTSNTGNDRFCIFDTDDMKKCHEYAENEDFINVFGECAEILMNENYNVVTEVQYSKQPDNSFDETHYMTNPDISLNSISFSSDEKESMLERNVNVDELLSSFSAPEEMCFLTKLETESSDDNIWLEESIFTDFELPSIEKVSCAVEDRSETIRYQESVAADIPSSYKRSARRSINKPVRYVSDTYRDDTQDCIELVKNKAKRKPKQCLKNLSDFEKYRRIRKQNNEASRKCRLNSKVKVQKMSEEVIHLENVNHSLGEKQQDLLLKVKKMKALYDALVFSK